MTRAAEPTKNPVGLDACAHEPIVYLRSPNSHPPPFVEELKTSLRSALGPELVAVYLYGSAVSGGFDEGVSDIDLLVVTAQDLNDKDIERIEALHTRIVERHPE
jgi:hypothetical protein